MSALEWAEAILRMPTSSKATMIKSDDLPASSGILADCWSESLRNGYLAEEPQKTILRALRLSRLPESHGLIISSVTPLLLSTLPSIRLQAAGTLLQYTSIASSGVLQDELERIVSTIAKVLDTTRLPFQPASSTICRFVSTCFRILATLVTKLGASPDIVASIIMPLSEWVYHGFVTGAKATPVPARGRTNVEPSRLTPGVLNAFSQTSISPKKAGSTILPLPTPNGEREAGSESESDDGRRDRRNDSAQVRLDALICLRALAKSNPQGLQKYWNHFLADSPYLRNRSTLLSIIESDTSREVRLQACLALEAILQDSTAYLAIAQDRPNKASFTSLSTKIGETVAELHLSLISFLNRPIGYGQMELRQAVLNVAKQLARCSPYGRMKRSLAGPLAHTVANYIVSEDPSIAEASLGTLTAIAGRYRVTRSVQTVGWRDIADQVERLLDRSMEERVEVALWRFLASAVLLLPMSQWNTSLHHLERSFEQSSPSIQAVRVTVILSFFPSLAVDSQRTSLEIPAAELPDPILLLVHKALRSPHSTSRALICSILPHLPLTSVNLLNPFVWANTLSRDGDAEVAKMARRALGLLLRNSNDTGASEYGEAVDTLIESFMVEGDVDVDAAWALANACDSLTENVSHDSLKSTQVAQKAITLLESASRDEALSITCMRILGSMLRLEARKAPYSGSLLDASFSSFSRALESTSAKMRWNTCTSLSNALPNLPRLVLESNACTALFEQLIQMLTEDPSYKVRIHTASVLTTRKVMMTSTHGGGVRDPDPERITRAAREAKTRLQTELEQGSILAKERRHVEVLIRKLDYLDGVGDS